MANDYTDQTEDTTSDEKKPKPCPHCPDDPDACDPELIANYKCKADGLAEQSKVWEAEKQPLADARAKYGDVLAEYRNKRSRFAPQILDMKNEVKHLIERIRCMIQQEHVRECLDQAFLCIEERLEDCPSTYYPPCTECDFDLNWKHLPLEEIQRRLASYKRQLDEWKAAFAKLEHEPQNLEDRVNKRKQGIEAIKAGLLGDPATTDLKRLYAMAKVEYLWLEQVWWGFDDTSAFVDALCTALTCWAKAVEAVAVYAGAEKYKKCKENAAAEDCQNLKEHTVDELLLVYEQLCPKTPCDDDHKDPCDDDNSQYDRDRSDDRRRSSS